MRKFTLPLLFTLMIVNAALGGEVVDVASAKIVAANFCKNLSSQQIRVKSLSIEDVQVDLVHQETVSDGELKSAIVPCYYVFNINNNEGFVIISANNSTKPILGYSFSGEYDEDAAKPAAFLSWMDDCKEQILEAKANNLEASEAISQQWANLSGDYSLKSSSVTNSVAPLLTTQWNQSCYYNEKCPVDSSSGYCNRVVVGCVAVAMGEIIKYWNYPVSNATISAYTDAVYGTIEEIPETVYDWQNMSNKLSSSSTEEEIDAISTLLYHCAAAVRTEFGASSSSAYLRYVTSSFPSYFKYASDLSYVKRRHYSTAAWDSLLINELNNSRPIFYSNGSHAFVCDGYQSEGLYHFNWGWSGLYDGYFYLDVTEGEQYISSSVQVAIIGIQPKPTEDITLSDIELTSQSTNGETEILNFEVTQNYSGDSTVVDDVYLHCYYSLDSTLDESDTLLASDIYSSINATDTFETENITLTVSLAFDSGYVIFEADATNVIREADETNNYACVYVSIPEPKSSTGSDVINVSADLLVYPNPSRGKVFVDCNQFSGDVDVEIFSLDGKKIYNQFYYSPDNVELDLNSQYDGVYVLKISDEECVGTKKVVLRKQ